MDFSYSGFEFNIHDYFLKNTLFIAISGSHGFGWTSKNSDLDLRIVTMPDLQLYVDPFFNIKTTQWDSWHKIYNIDVTVYPIKSTLQLLAKGNGNILDNLFEDKLYERKSDLVKELKCIIASHLHKGFLNHCLGYSQSVKRDLNIDSRINKFGYGKLLLERYREILKGMLLCEGKIEHNLVIMLNSISTKYCESILNSVVNNETLCINEVSNAIVETDSLDNELKEMVSKSDLPSIEQSTIEVPLSRWLRRYYFGKSSEEEKYEQKCS